MTSTATPQQTPLRPIDTRFAAQLGALYPDSHALALRSAAWISHRLADGHVCLTVGDAETRDWLQTELDIVAPDPVTWKNALEAAGFVGQPGDFLPLILDGDRLYLHRYWHYESTLATALRERAQVAESVDMARLGDGLKRLFTAAPTRPDWQKVAAAVAVLRRFAVISGGPGTGKTHTLAAILALLLEQAGDTRLRIRLAAPTGKAAARIAESLDKARARLDLNDDIRAALPDKATTLHRLLGLNPGRSQPRFDADHPLPLDVLVIDEASMIDLPLMAKTVAALPQHARLILLGDKDQLASVEAGNVLADICGDGGNLPVSGALAAQLEQLGIELAGSDTAHAALADSIVLLRHSYRFAAGGAIAQLAQAVNAADTRRVRDIRSAAGDGITFLENPDRKALLQHVVEHYRPLCTAENIDTALAALNRFRVLTALRRGPDGVEQLNIDIEQALRRAHLIPASPTHSWYQGRPVMITRNAPDLRLFNGDVGLCWPDPEAPDRLRVVFPDIDGSPRWLSPQRLPEHETVFAMTVHKSQGSEFGEVLLLLSDHANPVTTRELVYTGITRARDRITVVATDPALNAAIATRTQRGSGLLDRCWG
ncbi:MAG: exodeoxyribonuclease V subunit alpha [Gammaproteobacteria bacterium]|nr:exodeoxyribonuclease V subunit alpha [Gammaproteobacteria bacterium]